MFGVAVWKWFVAFSACTLIAIAGIPVISPLAGLLGLVPSLVIFLVVLRFFGRVLGGMMGGSGGYSSTGSGTEQHDAILRRAGRL